MFFVDFLAADVESVSFVAHTEDQLTNRLHLYSQIYNQNDNNY